MNLNTSNQIEIRNNILTNQNLQLVIDKITDLKLTAPVLFLLESIFPLRQTAYCVSEFCAPIGDLFFKNSFQVLQSLFSDPEIYQNFLTALEAAEKNQKGDVHVRN